MKLKVYSVIPQPNHVETVVAEVEVDGEPHLVKLSRYHDNQQFWTVPGERDERLAAARRSRSPSPSPTSTSSTTSRPTRTRSATSRTRASPMTRSVQLQQTMLGCSRRDRPQAPHPGRRRGARLPASLHSLGRVLLTPARGPEAHPPVAGRRSRPRSSMTTELSRSCEFACACHTRDPRGTCWSGLLGGRLSSLCPPPQLSKLSRMANPEGHPADPLAPCFANDGSARAPEEEYRLVCVGCCVESEAGAVGWRAYLDDDGAAGTFCPECAEREFGDEA